MRLTLEEGRPLYIQGRPQKEIRTYELLEKLQIPFQRIDHEPMYTIDACGEVDQVLGTEICKNLFLCNSRGTEYYLLLLPGRKKFITKEVSGKLGTTRLSFAGEAQMAEYLDLTPGSVSVMGLMNDTGCRVQLVIDREVKEQPSFACHPCINTSSIRMSTADLLEKFLPAVHHTPVFLEL
ncbi:prolyl-tRNA synthetase associated domain-containing protein [Lactonifactor longoviformis]|uniref:prolyl-tRNA synthetase associated domain-containing protein n=1 Tax=Lactonifactor longoviformis TaxID=341220 RepID=UPI001D025687|nr:prolyl-tRNA synthetase associated domain-containing protein [Lactonifactor longoviformis]MCB5713368.1 prolyl-tRNA synthetase associated domain-containing protein [Lactonifactor longoviformis]MCB5716670.1 prolyl-tRNA synthetase associated domain-containing protein [Lactonifactor longoviformis]